MQLPPENVRTLCEINSQLYEITSSSKRLNAPACPDIQLANPQHLGSDLAVAHTHCPTGEWPTEYNEQPTNKTTLAPIIEPLKQCINFAFNLPLAIHSGFKSKAKSATLNNKTAAWHPTKPIIAAAQHNTSTVQLFDVSSHIPILNRPSGDVPATLNNPQLVLTHELQQGIKAMAWRPNAGTVIAVAGSKGVCLWDIGKSNISLNSNTGLGSSTTIARDAATASLTWLNAPTQAADSATVTSIAWHPKGRLLAGTSADSPGIYIWDVATGSVSQLRAGLETVSLLRWSPTGDYLLTGHTNGSFRLWETSTWWSESWGVPSSGSSSDSVKSSNNALVEAAWSPDGRSVLIIHSKQVSMLHLTAEAPNLTAQVLPTILPGLSTHLAKGDASITAAAWDVQGKRLAIAIDSEGSMSAPCVAVYDARCDPLLTARLIGVMRLGSLGGGGASSAVNSEIEADWEIVEEEEQGGENTARVERSSSADVELLFHNEFAPGALLAVKHGQRIALVPMFFAS